VDTHLLQQVQPKSDSGELGPLDLDVIATLPRPVLLGVVGVVVIGAVLFATHRPGATSSTSSTSAPPAASPTTKPTTKPGSATASKPNSTQKPATPSSKSAAGSPGLPGPVKHALDAKKVVVILFWNPRAVDDRSVKSSVDRLPRRHGKVAVFSDSVKNLSRYTRITAATSVTQTPSLVVVNRKGQAEVQTGYLDYQTVGQYVQNALRR
jgi:hypothetical protein